MAQPDPGRPPRRQLVLVVDDTPQIRELIRVNLQLEGLEVITAADGQQALELLRWARPAVVTLDLRLPVVDGIDVLTQLRADAATAHTGVLVVSASAQSTDRAQALDAGADGFLAKPFDPQELVARVCRLADEASARAES